MFVLQRLLKNLKATCLSVSWLFLLAVTLIHMMTSWLIMGLAGEDVASTFSLWTYFYLVSVSTTGYGDLSPTTTTGQWAAVLYLIPGGIALFAGLIGKATVSINTAWQKRVKGMGNYEALTGHTLVIGWHGDTTEEIIDILQADTDLPDEIVLCVVKEMTNPRPADLKFVRGESFSNAELLKRAGIAGASRIIIYDQSDERVATVALSAYHLKSPDAHIVAHCENPHTAAMLRRTLPGIETTEALSVEMLVRSATDAGISRVINELLAVSHGNTQYQVTLSDVPAGACYGDLFYNAKRVFNVTVLGVSDNGHAGDVLNPPAERSIKNGDIMFYMAESRLTPAQIQRLLTNTAEGH